MIIKKFSDARHIEARLGIGCPMNRVQRGMGLSVERWLQSNMNVVSPYPKVQPRLRAYQQAVVTFRKTPKKDRVEQRKLRRREGRELTMWWLELLHRTDFPMQERMTLFWHNHFTSSLKKVKWAQPMYFQNILFREHALGSFSDLLHEIYQDPAMLSYLDGMKSEAKNPNENFARELLELFTLGVGHYSEQDIVNAARAFTGYRYNPSKQRVILNAKKHDNGVKIFLGKSGRFDAKDIVNILLDHPRTSVFIAEKFWQHFISLRTPPPSLMQRWASVFKRSGYQISALLMEVIKSKEFWSVDNRGALIKSPVDLAIGLLRELQLDQFRDYKGLRKSMVQLGQDLFNPPDVKGWRGGKVWLNHTTFTRRVGFVEKTIDEFMEMSQMRGSPITRLSYQTLSELLLPVGAANNSAVGNDLEAQLLALCTDPAYQLR